MKIGSAVFPAIFCLIFIGNASCDVVYTKDGKEVRGIVVEEYKDRIVFSTVDGEVKVLKSDINELYYDSEEDNLVKLAEQALERNDNLKAFAYYDKAFKVNPNSKKAKDGLVFVQGYLFRKEQSQKEEAVKRQEDFEHHGEIAQPVKGSVEEMSKEAGALKDSVGITIKLNGSMPEITSVRNGSPAYEAGVQKGDYIAAIWGRLTGYMSLEEVMTNIIEKSSLEVKCTMEHTADIPIREFRTMISTPNDMIGASFSMEFDGLTVTGINEGGAAALAGVQNGDLVIFIDGQSTRYMPLAKAVDLIRTSKNSSVKLTVRREITFWRT